MLMKPWSSVMDDEPLSTGELNPLFSTNFKVVYRLFSIWDLFILQFCGFNMTRKACQ